jgi:vancomycin resistance protein YoaR
VSEQPRTSDTRVVPWLLLGLALLAGGLVVAAHLLTTQRIPLGTRVDGTAIGGLRPVEAQARLTRVLTARAARPLSVAVEDRVLALRPATAGFAVDVPATVARARPPSGWDLHRTWDWFAGGTDVDAVVRVDRAALARAVAGIAGRVDEPAVQGGVRFADGQVEARWPRRGRVLDRPAAAVALRRAFLHDGGSDRVVALRTRVQQPLVTADEVSRVMGRFANPAVSGPVSLRFAGHVLRMGPREVTPLLSVRAVDGRLEPHVDRARLLARVGPRLDRLTREPQDAVVRVVGGAPQVVPARAGRAYDADEVVGGLVRVLADTTGDRVLPVRSVAVPPVLGTAAARALRITERIAVSTTGYPNADHRTSDLRRAAALLDGTLLLPGGTLSLNRTVGARTAANGFSQGHDDWVSQLAGTLFDAAFRAGLRVPVRTAHPVWVSRYPTGLDAVVSWPDVDLEVADPTPYGVLVQASVTPSTSLARGSVSVALWSTRVWDVTVRTDPRTRLRPPATRSTSGPGCVPRTGYDGFDVVVHRLFRRPGATAVDHEDATRTRYAPADTVLCSGQGTGQGGGAAR